MDSSADAVAAFAAEPVPRVIFINRYYHPDLSATSQFLHDLTVRLVQRGLAVHVLCSRQLYEDPLTRLPVSEVIGGVQVHRLRTTRFGRNSMGGRALDYLSFHVACLVKLLQLLRRGDMVVAKTDPPLISVVAAVAIRLRRARLINWLQDIFPEVASQLGVSPLPAVLDAALRRVRDASLRAASLNVVLGERMGGYLAGRDIGSSEIRIIENWSDAVQPLPPQSSSLRAELKLSECFVVGYSGNLGLAHDFRAILESAVHLRSDRQIVFLMIGGGANMARLKAQVAQLGLGNMRFLPYQPRERLSDSLAAADVHLACLKPELEGLIVPSKCYGVFAAGRPLIFIGDPDGDIPRIVRTFGCGRVVEDGDGLTLARLISELKDDPAARSTMGSEARRLFLERYTADRAADEWCDALRKHFGPQR